MFSETMARRIEIWPIEKLVPYARNPRTHSDQQVMQIAASIAEFGFVNPILVDTDAGILAGHGRLQGAQKLMLKEVPVIVLDYLTPAQRRAYLLADNKLAELAGWDEDLLKLELPGASAYVCHASSVQREFQNALEVAGFIVRCQIIWAKNHFAWGHGRYKFQHEPIFYCHVARQSDAWYGDKSQSTLWQEKKPAANRLHPTMKPVELIERALLNSSKGGDCVLDLFGGSGSTLIACERRNRNARLMELDARYTDVIVRRWQAYSGQKALLAGEDRSFDEVAAERLV